MIKKLSISCLGTLLLASSLFAAQNLHEGEITKIQDAGMYVYINLKKQDEQIWAAVTKSDFKVGDKVVLEESVWMKNFESKTLGKTFDKILFAQIKTEKGTKQAIHGVDNIHSIHGQVAKKPIPSFNKITISKEKAIKTSIKSIYENTKNYKNKNISIQGEVVEVSNKVLGNTWIKVQDQNEAIIFRSPNEDEKVKIGDKIKATATINTDVDYGYGFKYKVIAVNAKIEKI